MSKHLPPLLSGAGALLGPLVLTQIAFLDHLRRYHTASEFWGGFISVPVGLVSGAVLGAGLGRWLGRRPSAGRWLAAAGLFVAGEGLVWICTTLILALIGMGV